MRRFLVFALLLVLAAMAVPVLFVSHRGDTRTEEKNLNKGPEVRVLISQSGKVVAMPLEQYITGVVAAEMPAAFPLEALKAQAVAARTYTLKRMESGSDSGDKGSHPQADVCTDFNHCQAWIDKEEMMKRWGAGGDKYYRKILAAVSQTFSQAIYYNNAYIDPVYHSTSNGRTENSEDVWGTKVPYLRSVASRWDSASPKFHSSVAVPLEVFSSKLGYSGAVQVSTLGNVGLISPLEYTSTGRLKTVRVAGKTLSSTELRSALGLPSTDLTWEVSQGKVVFKATGNGHGVGMSQYGARGMALEGHSFQEILRHYYTGVEIKAAY